jgi:LEA14-like dessication related protein
MIKTKRELVLKEYPNAKPIKVKNHVEIWCNNIYLGQGKTNKQAWAAAYNQNIN